MENSKINARVYTSVDDFLNQNEALGTDIRYTRDLSCLTRNIKIGKKTVRNRLVCQAMEGCDGTYDGKPGELTQRRYSRLARGGAGMIWFEATAVMHEGRANPRQLYINEGNLDSFKRQVNSIKEEALKSNGAEPIIIMQATHSGRYSKPEGVSAPLIAYNNPIYEKDSPLPKENIVSDDYITRVGEALAEGALLAERAGFDGVDIKSCHRYLCCELLSAYNREGAYGGSLENRTRLLRDSIRGAMQNCSRGFIVTTRFNAYDGIPYPYGFGVSPDKGIEVCLDETKWLVSELESYGVELINVTMGNPYFNPHVNRPFAVGAYEAPEHPLVGVARSLKIASDVKSFAPGIKVICSATTYLGVASAGVGASYVEDGSFDFVGYGRQIFAYPDFANDIIHKGELNKDKCCICCSKCTEIMRKGSTPGCVIRDAEVYLPIYKECLGKDKK